MEDNFLDKLLNSGTTLFGKYIESKSTKGNSSPTTPAPASIPANTSWILPASIVGILVVVFLLFRRA